MTLPSSLPRRLGLAMLLFAGTASAQFRPPPMTEAERIVRTAEEARVEANKALVDQDKGRAKSRFEAALARYEEALKLDPDLAAAAEGIGECGTALGDHQRVANRLLPYVKDHPSDITAAYHTGVALLKLRRFPEGIPLLERTSAANRPEHYLAHYYLGRYYLYEQRAEPAIAEFHGYLSQRPEKLSANDHEVLLLLGHAYLYNRAGAYAREAFQRGQKGRPEDLNFQMGIAASFEIEGRLQDAVSLLEGLGTRFPNAPEPRERLGWLMLQSGNAARAEQAAQAALNLKQSAGGWHLLGEVKMAQKKLGEAEQHLRKALEQGPTLDLARLTLARVIQLQGRNDEAIALLEEARRNGLNSVDLWATLGSVYRRAGRYQEAIEAHRKVVEGAPTFARGFVLLGADRYATGEWDEAIVEYTHALEREPTHAGARHWLALSLTQRARVLARREQLGDAARDLRRAFDLERTAPMARSLAAVLMTQKTWPEAIEVLSVGVKLPGAGWQEHMLHGYALLGGGKAAEAVAAFEAASRLTKERDQVSDIYAGWALAKLELGEFDTAVSRLMEPTFSKTTGNVTRNNLPVALVRRALGAVESGNLERAAKDLDAVDAMKNLPPEVDRLALYARALIDVEQGRFSGAQAKLRRALAGKERDWERASTQQLTEAWAEYRAEDLRSATRLLAQARKRSDPAQSDFVTQLDRAITRREGELAYTRGALPQAEKAFKAALADDPLNNHLQHNLACVQYRRGSTAPAVEAWTKVAPSISQSWMNLGIDAQLRRKDIADAVAMYARYASSGGPGAGTARDWKQRLQAIYGISEPSTAKVAEERQ